MIKETTISIPMIWLQRISVAEYSIVQKVPQPVLKQRALPNQN